MNGWEHLFHFTQDGNTEIDLEQSGVPYGPGPTNPRYKADASNVKRNAKRSGRDWRPTTTCWHLTYKSKATKEITKEIAGEKKHPAIFPEELVEKCIKVSGLKKGIMFDCFAGTGTSLLVAKKMGLDYFGCDLDEDYVDFMKSRIGKEEVWEKFI
jgi:site-specific DNA-methyltransferase (adenine-specific)